MDHNEETEERSEKKEKRFTLNPGVNVKNLNKNVIYLIAAGIFIFIFMIALTPKKQENKEVKETKK